MTGKGGLGKEAGPCDKEMKERETEREASFLPR